MKAIEILENPSRGIDVSIILNVHREVTYLRRTFISLDESAAYAAECGIRCELIVVRDRTDAATSAWTDRWKYSAYARHEIIDVDNGSLGLSRNSGIARATGKYVLTADADDLVSYNYIAALANAARATGGRVVYFPEWYLGFGCDPHLYRMSSLDVVTPFALVDYHPYVSRCLLAREYFAELGYADLRLSKGFAYEDWHFNIQALGAGFDLRVVPSTIVYYRQRPGSLLRLADGLSNGITAHAPLFDPATFLALTTATRETAARAPAPELIDPATIRADFLRNLSCWEMTVDAAEIDPAIDPGGLEDIHTFSNVGGPRMMGLAYHDLCRQVGTGHFDEVLLLSAAGPDGGARYVASIVFQMLAARPERRGLVIAGQMGEHSADLASLPANAVFVDLHALAPHLDNTQRCILTLRIIEASAANARIHIHRGAYATEMVKAFGSQLAHHEMVYYRLGDTWSSVRGRWLPRGDEFDFMSEYGHRFGRIVAADAKTRRCDVLRLDALAGRYVTLYDRVDPHETCARPVHTIDLTG